MNIDDLKAAIERRGYEVRQLDLQPIAGYTRVYILRGEMFMSCSISHEDIDAVLIGVGELAEYWLRHFTLGQHHMWCARCHEPLLFTEKYVPGPALDYGVPLREVNQGRMEQEYRSAKAGPTSKELTVCPGCGCALSGETTKEIVDG